MTKAYVHTQVVAMRSMSVDDLKAYRDDIDRWLELTRIGKATFNVHLLKSARERVDLAIKELSGKCSKLL